MAKKKNGPKYPWHELPWTEEVFLDFVNKNLDDGVGYWDFKMPKKYYNGWAHWIESGIVEDLILLNKTKVDEYFFNLKVNKILK